MLRHTMPEPSAVYLLALHVTTGYRTHPNLHSDQRTPASHTKDGSGGRELFDGWEVGG